MEFTLEQAMRAQAALRQAASLPPESFPLPAFIGMLSDEIETLRKQGKTDSEIAGLINGATQSRVAPEDIQAHYASAEERRR